MFIDMFLMIHLSFYMFIHDDDVGILRYIHLILGRCYEVNPTITHYSWQQISKMWKWANLMMWVKMNRDLFVRQLDSNARLTYWTTLLVAVLFNINFDYVVPIFDV